MGVVNKLFGFCATKQGFMALLGVPLCRLYLNGVRL